MTQPLEQDPSASGPVSFGASTPRAAEATAPVAVLVCHGMGQQVRYETISSVAAAIRREAEGRGCRIEPTGVHLAQANGDFLARAEVRWTDRENQAHEVHVYEAYWAPLTEGQVTYRDTMLFLAGAAWSGLRHSLWPGSFQRWVFGGSTKMTIGRLTFFGLLVMSLVLLGQAGLIALASWKVASWVKDLQPGNLLNFRAAAFPWVRTLEWLGVIAWTFIVRYFIVEFVGDVAAYVAPYKDSKFDELRGKIRAIGLNVGKVVYGFGPPSTAVPHYARVVVVGHSLGSVLAYDTLNSLMDLDNVAEPQDRREVVARTRALITFGSPLDKTAFIFRMQANKPEDWIRERLAAAMQPLILDYDLYRPAGFEWINIWSPMDIISGSLDYYDAEHVKERDRCHVRNMIDKKASVPLYAHVQYWGNEMLREQIYRAVTQASDAAAIAV